MADLPSLPFPRSYWVIPGKLLAGLYPGSLYPDEALTRMDALFKCGIRKIINLMEVDERNYQGQLFIPYMDDFHAIASQAGTPVGFARYPIRDMQVPDQATMRAILDDVDSTLHAGQPVYVHCWGGKGRTGTVIGCHLVRKGVPPAQALDQIAKLRQNIQPYSPSPETDEQRAYVLSWKPGN